MDSFKPRNGEFRTEHIVKEIEEIFRNLKVRTVGDEFLIVVMMASLIEKKIKMKISERYSSHLIFNDYFFTYFLKSNLNEFTIKNILEAKKLEERKPDSMIVRAYTFNSIKPIRKILQAIALSDQKFEFSDSNQANPIYFILKLRNKMVHELEGMNNLTLRNRADALRTNFDTDLEELMRWVDESFLMRLKIIKDLKKGQKSENIKKCIEYLKKLGNDESFYHKLYTILHTDVKKVDLEKIEITHEKNNFYEKELQNLIQDLESIRVKK